MSQITIKEYFAAAGSRLTDKDARILGPTLVALGEQGEVTAASVVEAARSENCPMHSYFEWDDTKAAGLYREGQASEIINTVRVRYVSQDDGMERSTRAYRIVRDKPQAIQRASVYLPRETPVFDPNDLMGDALQELQQWRLKYRPYAELLGEFKDVAVVILNQIGEFMDEFRDVSATAQPLEAISDLSLWVERHGAGVGPAAQFAEQFKFMMDVIQEAEHAFDPDTKTESALARENRMLRERLAAFDGDVEPQAIAIQRATTLTRTEAAILSVLLERETITNDAVLRAIYPRRTDGDMPQSGIVDVCVCKIRAKLKDAGIAIETLRGVGYQMPASSKARLRDMISAKPEAA